MLLSIKAEVTALEFKALESGALNHSEVFRESLNTLLPCTGDKLVNVVPKLFGKDFTKSSYSKAELWYVRCMLAVTGKVTFTFEVSVSEEVVVEALDVSHSVFQDVAPVIKSFADLVVIMHNVEPSFRSKNLVKTFMSNIRRK